MLQGLKWLLPHHRIVYVVVMAGSSLLVLNGPTFRKPQLCGKTGLNPRSKHKQIICARHEAYPHFTKVKVSRTGLRVAQDALLTKEAIRSVLFYVESE